MANFYQYSGMQSPKKVFLDRQSPLQYGELHKLIGQFTAYLKTTTLTAGDKVVVSSNDDGWLSVIFFALIDNGITVVISDSKATQSEFSTLCKITQPDGYIIDSEMIKRCMPDDSDSQFILPISKPPKKNNLIAKLLKKNHQQNEVSFPSILNDFQPDEPSLDLDIDRIAYIILTSGSTSQPKAVPISWTALHIHLGTLKKHFSYDGQSRILNLLPLFHADGLIQGPTVACFSGAIWVRPFSFSIANIEPLLHIIYRRRITHFVCVPTILALLLRLGAHLKDSFETDDFKFIISTAGKLDEHLWQDFQDNFNVTIANVYGLTETVVGVIFNGPNELGHKIGSIGKPVDCEVKIVDENGYITQNCKSGELLVRGENVFSGYLNADEINQELFHNGWMRTGDLAYKDASGFFYITGRIKNVVISGGENIYPEEVTEVIVANPAIASAITFGIPNSEWGESLVALIVIAPQINYDETSLIQWCRQTLSNYKVPKIWHVVDELPYGPSGKILLPEAKKLYEEHEIQSAPSTGKELDAKILTIAANTFHCPVETLTQYSAISNTAGWDSLAHITLVVALESEFNIKMTTAEIMQIETLNTAIEIVKSKSLYL